MTAPTKSLNECREKFEKWKKGLPIGQGYNAEAAFIGGRAALGRELVDALERLPIVKYHPDFNTAITEAINLIRQHTGEI